MELKKQLQALKEKFESSAPKEAKAIIHRATDMLKQSGILGKALSIGGVMPEFSLKNAEGRVVESKALFSRGPLVLTFYRGKW